MTVTNNLQNEMMKIVATKTARFEDVDRANPLPAIFENEQAYQVWQDNMYFLIVDQYKAARSEGPEAGAILMRETLDEIGEAQAQLNGYFPRFREGLREYAFRTLPKAQAQDLMDTIKHYEINGQESREAYEQKKAEATVKDQAEGFEAGQTGVIGEGKLRTDFEREGLATLEGLFGGD